MTLTEGAYVVYQRDEKNGAGKQPQQPSRHERQIARRRRFRHFAQLFQHLVRQIRPEVETRDVVHLGGAPNLLQR